MESILVRAMAPDTSGNLMENVPPKPQHSSAAPISASVRPRTFARSFRGAGFDAQLAQSVAAIVIGDDAVESRADIFDAGDFEQETRKLPDARLERVGFGEELGIVLEDVGKMMRDHRRARTGGHHDVFRIAKDIQEMPGDFPRFVRIAGIECGLAAAGLRFGEIDRIAQPLQHLSDGDADLRENLIDDAGDEQGDARVQLGSLTCRGD